MRGNVETVVSGKEKGQDLSIVAVEVGWEEEEGVVEFTLGVAGTLEENGSDLSYAIYLANNTVANPIAISCNTTRRLSSVLCSPFFTPI